MQIHQPSPAALANARAAVLDANTIRCHPALIAGAWATLKAARGQTVVMHRLRPAHLVEAGPDTAPTTPGNAVTAGDMVTHIDAIRARSISRIRARAAILGLPHGGGDAA